MKRRSYEELPSASLREHGDAEQIDRVWARIERDLPARPKGREPAFALWVPALGLCLFGAGVFVGMGLSAEAPQPALVAEPGPVIAEQAGSRAGAAEPRSPLAEEPRAPRSQPFRPLLRAPSHEPVESPVPSVEESIPPPPAAVISPPAWQGLAEDGRYDEALGSIEQQGGFDAALSQATAEQLMLLVDVARATGRRERAVTALRRVVNQHGADPNAPLAAWMLGNELGRMGDAAGASQAFAMYRALSPQGDFAQDALTRQFEVALEGRDLEQAQALADQYARDFPDGPRMAEMHVQLEELRALVHAASELGPVPGAGAAQNGPADSVEEAPPANTVE